MKNGFSLIEVIIGVAISSILSIALFLTLNQTQRSAKFIENKISNDPQLLIFQNQFEKDVTGIFVPEFWHLKQQKTTTTTEIEVEKKENQENITKATQNKKTEQKQQKIPKTFFSSSGDKKLQELTFITCNPLQMYENIKPRIVRVIYSMEQQDDYFVLYRQETLELDYNKIEKDKLNKFSILTRIKNFELKYFYYEKEEENKDDDKNKSKQDEKEMNDQKKEEPKKELKIMDKWSYPREEKDKKLPKIPQYVELKLILVESDLQKEVDYVFRYVIYGQPVKRKKSMEENKDLKKESGGNAQKLKDQLKASGIGSSVMDRLSKDNSGLAGKLKNK